MKLWLRMFWMFLTVRFRSRCTLLGPCVTPFHVWPNDLDVNLHMNNGVYLTVADLGRLDLMLRSGSWRAIRANGWMPVVARQSIRFKRSLTLGQRYEIVTRVLGFDDRSIFIEELFTRKGQVVAKLIVDARILERGKPVAPHDVIAATGVDPDGLEEPEWLSDWVSVQRRLEGDLAMPSDI